MQSSDCWLKRERKKRKKKNSVGKVCTEIGSQEIGGDESRWIGRYEYVRGPEGDFSRHLCTNPARYALQWQGYPLSNAWCIRVVLKVCRFRGRSVDALSLAFLPYRFSTKIHFVRIGGEGSIERV